MLAFVTFGGLLLIVMGNTMNNTPLQIDHPALTEVSGITRAASCGNYWVVNDSGALPVLHYIYLDDEQPASYIGELSLTNVIQGDFEDLASYALDGERYILVADTGDNDEERPFVWLHLVKEPTLSANTRALVQSVSPAISIKVTYQDKPRDVEAVMIDTKAQQILLISKHNKRPRVYTVPLPSLANVNLTTSPLVIEQQAELRFKLKSIPKVKNRKDRITAGDISEDGQFLVLQNYHSAWLYPYDGNSWLSSLQIQPALLPVPPAPKIEGVSFDQTSQQILTASEKQPAMFSINQLPVELAPKLPNPDALPAKPAPKTQHKKSQGAE